MLGDAPLLFVNFKSHMKNEQVILRINKRKQKDTTINSDDDVRCDVMLRL